MLVLCRKETQTLTLGDPFAPLATITVVKLRDGSVRLGITASDDLLVLRGEVAEEITTGRPRAITPPPPEKGPRPQRSRYGRPRTGRWRDYPGNGGGGSAA